MNDRFKFRAWDKRFNAYVNTVYYRYFVFTDKRYFVEDRFTSGGGDFCNRLKEEYIIIEQCTGQKDKNGNLIFEGDVLKCGDVSPLLPVSFVDGAFVYTYGNMGNYQLRKEVLVNCEVVGTIHDPEYQDHFRDATKMVGTSMSPATKGVKNENFQM